MSRDQFHNKNDNPSVFPKTIAVVEIEPHFDGWLEGETGSTTQGCGFHCAAPDYARHAHDEQVRRRGLNSPDRWGHALPPGAHT